MPIVVDASALVEAALVTDRGRAVLHRLDRTRGAAPDLVNAEVVSAFRGLVARGSINETRAVAALAILADADVRRYRTTALTARVWDLRHNLSAYDATYVALAERLGCPLLTCDHRLATAPGLRTRVEAISP